MSKKSRFPTPLDFRLPSTVESIQQGWLISCQSSALISGFFAIASILLFVLFQNPSILSQSHSKVSNRIHIASEILAYASLILNISACASCFILLDRLGDVPYRAARKPSAPKGGQIAMPSTGILRVYGVGALWRWAVWHWLICFLFGFWAIMAQILLFVWTQLSASREAAIAVSGLAAFCLLPWMAFIFAPLVNGLNSFRAHEDVEDADEASFGAAGDDLRAFPRYESRYRLSGMGRSPDEPFRVSFTGHPPVLGSPTARRHNAVPHSPTARISQGDNRTRSSSS